MGFSRRAKMILGNAVSTQFEPADGILIRADRIGSTGTVSVASGLVMPEGLATNLNNFSLWTTSGEEISMGIHALDFKHSDGSPQGIFLHKQFNPIDGTQFWLRTNTLYTEPREAVISAPPQQPASYWMHTPAYACAALPLHRRLLPYSEAAGFPSLGSKVVDYCDWILNDDYRHYPDGVLDGGARIALYGRTRNLHAMGLMRGEAHWHQKACALMSSPLGGNFLTSHAAGQLNNGNEWNLDPTECHYGYLITGCLDYLLMLDTMTKQLHGVSRLSYNLVDGTYYNIKYGWSRDASRAAEAAVSAANAGRVLDGGNYGPDTPSEITLATLPTRMALFALRVVMPDGVCPDPFLATAASVARSTDTFGVRLNANITQRYSGAEFTLTARDIPLPAGAETLAGSHARMVTILHNWNGSAIVSTPAIATGFTGTITAATANSFTDTATNIQENDCINWEVTCNGETRTISSNDLNDKFNLTSNWTVIPSVGMTYTTVPRWNDPGYNPSFPRSFYPTGLVGTKLGQTVIEVAAATDLIPGTTVLPTSMNGVLSGGLRVYTKMAESLAGNKPYNFGMGFSAAQAFITLYGATYPTIAADLNACMDAIADNIYATSWDAGLQAYYYGTNNSIGNGISPASNTASRVAPGAYPALNTFATRADTWRAMRDNDAAAKARSIAALISAFAPAEVPSTGWYSRVYNANDQTPYHRAGDECYDGFFEQLYQLAQVT